MESFGTVVFGLRGRLMVAIDPIFKPAFFGYLREMKNSIWILGPLSVAAFFTACAPDDSTTTSKSDTNLSNQLDRVQADATEARDDLAAYTHAQKEQYVESLSRRISILEEELDLLTTEVNNSSAAAQAEAKPRVAALRVQLDQLKEQLDQAEDATATTWDSVKQGTSAAYDDLKEGVQDTRQWMSDKIAP